VPTTPKLPLKLHERLGDEAMTELLTLFGDLGAESRAAYQELRDAVNRVERGLSDVKQEIANLKQQIADFKSQIVSVQGELIKWTFLFWLGTIGIVLLLIRFPR
jgi:chromosome segregation ATPase